MQGSKDAPLPLLMHCECTLFDYFYLLTKLDLLWSSKFKVLLLTQDLPIQNLTNQIMHYYL